TLRLVKVDTVSSLKPVGDFRPVLAAPGTDAKKAEAKANLQQIAKAAAIFLSDNEDTFPYVQSTASLWGFLLPYTASNRVFFDTNEGVIFRFNMNLAGVNVASVPDTASIPMFYE